MLPSTLAFMKKLHDHFPQLWLADGSTFSRMHVGTIRTGDGSEVDGMPAFDSYSPGYIMGVHPRLYQFLMQERWYAVPYDSHNVFLHKQN